jgi:putative tricarboxylic transport membrane protein
MKKYQVSTAFFWLALGLFMSFYSYRLGLGHVRAPGPGLFPFCLGVFFFLLALAVLVTAIRERNTAGPEGPAGDVRKLSLVIAALFAYALLIEFLGFQATTFLTLALLFRSAGYTKWRLILAYSLVIVVITYFLFTYLGVRFPPGVFRHLGLG